MGIGMGRGRERGEGLSKDERVGRTQVSINTRP